MRATAGTVARMFLSDLRDIARDLGYREAKCPLCPDEDWAPACTACDETTRIWTREDGALSDAQLARLGDEMRTRRTPARWTDAGRRLVAHAR